MLFIVSFLHVLEANIIDVTSVSGVGDGYYATLIAQSFYRMPAYKTYSCRKHVWLIRSVDTETLIRTRYADTSCHDVLCGARADVTDFSYMTLMDKSAVKHNMLKTNNVENRKCLFPVRVYIHM